MLRKIFYLLFSLLLTTTGFAGQKAVTDTGEEVILNNDGTWRYVNKTQASNKKIKTNSKKFSKPDTSSFLL